MRSVGVVLLVICVISCGRPEEEKNHVRTIIDTTSTTNSPVVQTPVTPTPPVVTPPQTHFETTTDMRFDPVAGADCDIAGATHPVATCPRVYLLNDPSTSVRDIQHIVHFTADPAGWLLSNPPITLGGTQSINCQIQICISTQANCVANSQATDLAQIYWDATSTIASLTDIAVNQSADMTVSARIPANTIYREFCHYHWFLDRVPATQPRVAKTIIDIR